MSAAVTRARVCIASLAPFVGGAEVAAERLAVGLVEVGYDVFVVLGKRGAVMERMQRQGLRCIQCPLELTDRSRWWRYLWAQSMLRRLLRRERPALVHSMDFPTHQTVAEAAGRLGIPRICHHRGLYGQEAFKWFNKFGAERHLFVSRALIERMGVNSTPLEPGGGKVVHDGVPLPPEPDPDLRRMARKGLGLPDDRLIVAFSGRIEEAKGVADLLRAWSLLQPGSRERSMLLLMGDATRSDRAYRLEVVRAVESLGPGALLVGFQENVGEWLLASDIAVVPSRFESLSNATLEAMSYGLPVIGCAVGGIPEMILNEETGLLVRPQAPAELAAALQLLLSDEALRLRFGKRGRQRCEQAFSLSAHVRAVSEEYDRLLQGS